MSDEITSNEIKECPSCSQTQNFKNNFCYYCGHNFSSSITKTPLKVRAQLQKSKIKLDKNKKPIFLRDARIFVLIIAFITMGYYFYMYQHRPIDQLNAMPNILNLAVRMQPAFVFIFLGAIFFILFIWSFKNPISALVTCFAFYFFETCLNFFMGAWLVFGYFFLKIFITFMFVSAIKMQIEIKNINLKRLN